MLRSPAGVAARAVEGCGSCRNVRIFEIDSQHKSVAFDTGLRVPANTMNHGWDTAFGDLRISLARDSAVRCGPACSVGRRQPMGRRPGRARDHYQWNPDCLGPVAVARGALVQRPSSVILPPAGRVEAYSSISYSMGSRLMRISRGFAPSPGPIRPRLSRMSIIRAALV